MSKKGIINSVIIVILYLATAICYFFEKQSVTSMVFLIAAVAEAIVTIVFYKIKKKEL